ncbi:MAG: hypothetical protein ACM3OO_00060 [Planctomycetaceae bacterium]
MEGSTDRVSIRAAYERFPAGVKGALVLRGADGLPHQVRLVAARLTECSGLGDPEPVGIERAIVEAAPTMDTFVPFEVSTLELAAGWYRLECDVVVDGDAMVVRPGEPFSVAWPRGTVRRGTVAVGRAAGDVRIDVLECAGDSVRISYEAETQPHLRLSVDGAPHPVLRVEHDDHGGRGRVLAYPVLRIQERLAIEVKGAPSVEVALP